MQAITFLVKIDKDELETIRKGLELEAHDDETVLYQAILRGSPFQYSIEMLVVKIGEVS